MLAESRPNYLGFSHFYNFVKNKYFYFILSLNVALPPSKILCEHAMCLGVETMEHAHIHCGHFVFFFRPNYLDKIP